MEYKKDQILKELPNCVNCGEKVPSSFPVLTNSNNDDFPCCSDDCINKFHERITGKKPKWNNETDKK